MMESMERKEAIKKEGSMRWSSDDVRVAARNPLTGMMELGDDEKSSLGFMELLGLQDLSSTTTSSPPSIFDVLQTQTSTLVPESSIIHHHGHHHQQQQQPTTPNSSSISSQSQSSAGTSITPNDTLIQHTQPTLDEGEGEGGDEDEDGDGDGEEQQNTRKLLKPKKINQKRQREPRFAFMTKSEVDHLEDGYRWRKYGQKAVKNSSFPRSYYRCTTAACNVKKRVERSFNDPSIVMTTYEGKHTHPSPLMPRGGGGGGGLPPPSSFSNTYGMPQMQVSGASPHQTFNSGYLTSSNQRRFCAPTSALLRDHALLQDILPSLASDQNGRLVQNPHQYF